jgi:hypothetical protein
MARGGRKGAVKAAIGAAAIGVASSVTAVAVTQPASISASLVDLTALIVVGSSTNPSGAGVVDFFGGKFNDPIYTDDGSGEPDIIYVNFDDGPAGIQAAIDSTDPGERNAVLASGWGAANASLLLREDNPRLGNTVFILDNDVARPDGGFGTRYPLFALIGVNPYPTPSEIPGLRAVNIGYEYDYNSNAPAYALNPFSAVNALAAYLTTRLNQAEIDLPVDAEGRPIAPDGSPLTCGGANTCAITESQNVLACPDARCSSPGDRITAYVTTRDNTTYVTYTARELPLTTLIRGTFGDYIANVTAPLLKLAVDFGYYGGNPIPTDPSAYRPGSLFPSIGDIFTTLMKLPGAILQTIAAIFAPFQPKAAQTMSVARQLEPTDPIAGDTTDLMSNGTDEQMNVMENRFDAGPGGGEDDEGAGIIDAKQGNQEAGLGTGQPGPSQTDLTGTGTATGNNQNENDVNTNNDTGTGTGIDVDADVDVDDNTDTDTDNDDTGNDNDNDNDNEKAPAAA